MYVKGELIERPVQETHDNLSRSRYLMVTVLMLFMCSGYTFLTVNDCQLLL